MPLCVNRTFFTARFLTSAAAGGADPSSARSVPETWPGEGELFESELI